MILALLGPLLFLGAMYWMAESVFPDIVATAKENLASRALAGDVISARILSESIKQEVNHRIKELETAAATESVRQIIAQSSSLSAEELQAVCRDDSGDSDLARSIRQLNTARESASRLHTDRSWFLTDGTGQQVYRFPVEGEARTKSHRSESRSIYRDYFHGQGQDLNKGIDPRPWLLDASQVSVPHT